MPQTISLAGTTSAAETKMGIVYSTLAYTMWGLLPLYLRLVNGISPLEFVTHRVLWSVIFILAILGARWRWSWLREVFRSRAGFGASVASAVALAINWFIYVWATDNGHIVDASLGYFINPLFNVALGAMLLKERLSRVQWLAVIAAALGVLWLTVQLRQVPWIGLALAASFGTYGLLRKTAALGALEGLALETLLLAPFALAILASMASHGRSGFFGAGPRTKFLILMAGPITTVPLLLFAAGARRIPLSLVGLLQYIGPTLQLLVGVLVGHEAFGSTKLFGYALIWSAVALGSAEFGRHGIRGRALAR